MALPSARIGRCVLVALSRPLAGRSVSTSPVKSARILHGFEGVQAGYCWDHKNGFGYTNDGQVVIISPENCVGIHTPQGVEDEVTRVILEVAKETYQEKHLIPESCGTCTMESHTSAWSGKE